MPRKTTPARATQDTNSIKVTPVRANDATKPTASSPARATLRTNPKVGTPARVVVSETLRDNLLALRVVSSALDDLEQLRIANGNRVGAAERLIGAPLPEMQLSLDAIADAERKAVRALTATFKRLPISKCADMWLGVGDKTLARLIAVTGPPSLRAIGHWEREDRDGTIVREWVIDSWEPRTLGQFRAYCGHGNPDRNNIPKGATQAEVFAAGNPLAKKRVWLIGEGLLKASVRKNEDGSRYAIAPLGQVYIDARAQYAEATHEAACKRCGPSGHPAKPGTPLSDGHKHARALRTMRKQLLRELWEADRMAMGL